MLKTNLPQLDAELNEVIRLFNGGEDKNIISSCNISDKSVVIDIEIDTKRYSYFYSLSYSGQIEYKRLIKRYCKLSLYKALSDFFGVSMPWGALTGIRPVKLCYQQGTGFEDFLKNTMLVSDEKIKILREIVKMQEGIYQKDEKNCDLFVGIPFCPSKCLYCSFASALSSNTQLVEKYIDSLLYEIADSKKLIKNLRSVYIGGGTPTSIPKPLLKRVLEGIGEVLCEYTVEAGRPDCIDEETLELLKSHGVTRICVNPQTFSNDTLRLLGRKHTAEDTVEKYYLAKKYGFDINMDLIAALTGEKFEDFKYSIDKAIELNPENITVHTLCLKKGSKLKEQMEILPEGDVERMINYAHESLFKVGYKPYYLYRQKYMAGNLENTGYAHSGKVCIYNVDIMEEISQNVACGANAISKRVFDAENRIERYGAPKDIPTYIAKIDKIVEEKRALFSETK